MKGFTVKELLAFPVLPRLWRLFVLFVLSCTGTCISLLFGAATGGGDDLVGFWRSASDLTVKEAYDARRYREKTELLCYQSKEYERELDLYQEILEAVSEETERKKIKE